MSRLALAVLLLAAGCPKQGAGPPPVPPGPDQVEAPTPAAPREFTLEQHHLVLPGPIVFTSEALDESASGDALAHVLAFLEERPDVTRLRIEGHTDGDRSEEDVAYGGGMAWAVGEWLVARGVDCKRLVIAGYGGWKPIAQEGDPSNRRIDVVVAALRGHNIDGLPDDGGAPAATPDACP